MHAVVDEELDRIDGIDRVQHFGVAQHLRAAQVPYWQIFATTAVFYAIATLAYLGLIRATEQEDGGTGSQA